MRKIILIVVVMLTITFCGCLQGPINKKYQGGDNIQQSKMNLESFEKELEVNGYIVSSGSKGAEDFLSVIPTVLKIKDEEIGIFEYKSNEEMEIDAKQIDKTGFHVMGALYEFTKSPHFYKKDNIIVFYMGSNNEIKNAIEKIMGKQFAG